MEVEMAKTIPIPENSIIEILKALPQDTLMDILSKVLIRSDASPLTDEEQASYKKAIEEYEKGEVVSCEDLK
jgi:hypothetical protein